MLRAVDRPDQLIGFASPLCSRLRGPRRVRSSPLDPCGRLLGAPLNRSRDEGGRRYFENFSICSSVRSPRSLSLSFSVEARNRGRSSSKATLISSRLSLNAASTLAVCLSVSLRSRWMRRISQLSWPSMREPWRCSAPWWLRSGLNVRGNARAGWGVATSKTRLPVTTPAAKMTMAAKTGFQAFTMCIRGRRMTRAGRFQSRWRSGREPQLVDRRWPMVPSRLSRPDQRPAR